MKPSKKPPVPVNLVAGPLGVGKTTAINHLLAQRPQEEKWAVLVNEYGLVGLDAALLSDATEPKGVEVREVAGGCICCSASFMFDVSLVLLLQRRPDRLLIEPTGLATLSGILDTVGRPGIQEAVEVRSIISLLDPVRLEGDLERDDVKDQVEAADILLANRSDLASAEDLDAFDAWAKRIFPPKRFFGRIERGQVSVELLDLVSERNRDVVRSVPPQGEHRHLHDHGPTETKDPMGESREEASKCDAARPIVGRHHLSPVASTLGWVCWDGLVFDAERTHRWLTELSGRPGFRRVKAVLQTNEGWWSFNFSEGAEETRPSGYRRDSRLELVVELDPPPEPAAIEGALRDCLSAPLAEEA